MHKLLPQAAVARDRAAPFRQRLDRGDPNSVHALGRCLSGAWGGGLPLAPRPALGLLACGLAILACGPAAGLTGRATPTVAVTPTAASATVSATAAPTVVTSSTLATGGASFVPGSSQKVCQLTGEIDKQLNQATVNQTETRWGLVGNDLGYSFEHDGKLFFLFGDSVPTPSFNGRPNGPNSALRLPDDNDAIAFTSDTSLDHCLKLDFMHSTNGAFQNPVVLNAQGQPAITLRTDEIPLAGISDGGRMYVFFGTDNPVYPPGPTKDHLGFATRSVVGVSDDDATTFHYLYDFSKGPGAKFINLAIAHGNDQYLYFWGTQGGTLYRQSAPFLARKPVGSLGALSGIEYLHALNPDGTPLFMPSENDAAPLFHDTAPDAAGQPQTADCMGELGVEWNKFLSRWMMLYNCLNATPTRPHGIYMRLAEQPWGPWSAPQTIFNPARDGGLCHFIHRAVTAASPQCDNLSEPDRLADSGGDYGPYFISRFTTGDAARGTSTFYYTLSTWNPYTEVVMQTSIQRSP
jgi:hypothetical protein